MQEPPHHTESAALYIMFGQTQFRICTVIQIAIKSFAINVLYRLTLKLRQDICKFLGECLH